MDWKTSGNLPIAILDHMIEREQSYLRQLDLGIAEATQRLSELETEKTRQSES